MNNRNCQARKLFDGWRNGEIRSHDDLGIILKTGLFRQSTLRFVD